MLVTRLVAMHISIDAEDTTCDFDSDGHTITKSYICFHTFTSFGLQWINEINQKVQQGHSAAMG